MRISADNRDRALDWGTLAGAQKIAANLCTLLRLVRQEVPYDRARGLDPALVGTPVQRSDPEIRREVDRLMRWEPRAKLVDLQITHQRDGSVLLELTAEV